MRTFFEVKRLKLEILLLENIPDDAPDWAGIAAEFQEEPIGSVLRECIPHRLRGAEGGWAFVGPSFPIAWSGHHGASAYLRLFVIGNDMGHPRLELLSC